MKDKALNAHHQMLAVRYQTPTNADVYIVYIVGGTPAQWHAKVSSAATHSRETYTRRRHEHKTDTQNTHTHEQQRPHQKRTHAHIQQHYQLSSSHRRQIGDRAGMAIAHHAGIDPNFFATGGFADANPSMLMVITTAALHQPLLKLKLEQ